MKTVDKFQDVVNFPINITPVIPYEAETNLRPLPMIILADFGYRNIELVLGPF
jgi:hypothetical protein